MFAKIISKLAKTIHKKLLATEKVCNKKCLPNSQLKKQKQKNMANNNNSSTKHILFYRLEI